MSQIIYDFRGDVQQGGSLYQGKVEMSPLSKVEMSPSAHSLTCDGRGSEVVRRERIMAADKRRFTRI